MIDKTYPFPRHAKNVFKLWDEKTPIENIEPEPDQPINDIPVIEVHNIIDQETSETVIKPHHPSSLPHHTVSNTPEERWKTIGQTILSLDIHPKDITLYYAENGKRKVHLFDIILDKKKSQVIVEDNHAIFVLKDDHFQQTDLPYHRSHKDIKETQDISSVGQLCLLDRSDVWKFAFRSEENIRAQLKQYLFTAKEQLHEQEKHTVSWANKARMFQNSFLSTLIATGTIPSTTDKTPITKGLLKNVAGATFSKGYGALQRQTMKKFRDKSIHSYSGMWNNIIEEHPILETFLDAPNPTTIDSIKAGCQKIISEYNVAIHGDWIEIFADDNVTISGHSPIAIEFALASKIIDPDVTSLETMQVKERMAYYDIDTKDLIPITQPTVLSR